MLFKKKLLPRLVAVVCACLSGGARGFLIWCKGRPMSAAFGKHSLSAMSPQFVLAVTGCGAPQRGGHQASH